MATPEAGRDGDAESRYRRVVDQVASLLVETNPAAAGARTTAMVYPGAEDRPRVSVARGGFVYFNQAALDRLREFSGREEDRPGRLIRRFGDRAGDRAWNRHVSALTHELLQGRDLLQAAGTQTDREPLPLGDDGTSMWLAGATPLWLPPGKAEELDALRQAAYDNASAALHEGVARLGPSAQPRDDGLLTTASAEFVKNLALTASGYWKQARAIGDVADEVRELLIAAPPDGTVRMAAEVIYASELEALLPEGDRPAVVGEIAAAMTNGSTGLPTMGLALLRERGEVADLDRYVGDGPPSSAKDLLDVALLDGSSAAGQRAVPYRGGRRLEQHDMRPVDLRALLGSAPAADATRERPGQRPDDGRRPTGAPQPRSAPRPQLGQ